jgi:hypothetical protein
MSTNQPAGRILLKNVRLAFPNLWEPNTVNGEGKPRYSASLLMGQDHPQVEEIKRKIEALAKDKWRDKAASILAGLYKTDKVALHDGDTKAQYDGFPGNLFVASAAQENAAPTVIDRDRSPLSQRSGRPYPGCYVNASLEFWAQDNGYGKRINCTLRGIQFYADGDSFSAGRPADSDEFDDVSAGADAEDFA